jgi:hypothetical protein
MTSEARKALKQAEQAQAEAQREADAARAELAEARRVCDDGTGGSRR